MSKSPFRWVSAWWKRRGGGLIARRKSGLGRLVGLMTIAPRGRWLFRIDRGIRLLVPVIWRSLVFRFGTVVSLFLRPRELTLWKTCSRRISCNLALRSLTFWTMSLILVLSELSIWLVSPVARSNVSLTPPTAWPLRSQPPLVICEGVKQMRWSPESAALKVNRPSELPRVLTTRWSWSKSSSTVTVTLRSGFGLKLLVAVSYCSALYFPEATSKARG